MAGDAARRVVESARQRLIGRLGPDPVVLDNACGHSPLLRSLPDGWRRLGADVSGAALRRGRGAAGGAGCRWVQADAGRLPLRSGVVDAVVHLSSWWVLPDVAAAVAEGARVLRPGGVVVVHTWGPAPRCRLITLGAAAIARVLPEMIRPPGLAGPFDAADSAVTATLTGAGFRPPRGSRHRWDWPLGTVPEYWAEFAPLAPTSFSAYRGASADARATIDGILGRLLGQCADAGHGSLALTWHLAVAEKPAAEKPAAGRSVAESAAW